MKQSLESELNQGTSLPLLECRLVDWLSGEGAEDLIAGLSESQMNLLRMRWHEARRLKHRLAHHPFYQRKMARQGDVFWLVMAASYLP